MALDDILDHIRTEGEAEAAEIETAATAEAERLIAEAQERCDELATKAGLAATRREAVAHAGAVTAARIQTRKDLLAVRREAVEAALAGARERLSDLPKDEFAKTASTLLADRGENGEGWDEVIVPARYAKDGLAKALGLSAGTKVSAADDSGFMGLMLRRGRVRFNLSWDVVFRSLQERTEAELATLIFSETESATTSGES